AGVDHRDDGADRAAAATGRRFRSDLVRGGDDHRDGDGIDPSAGRAEPVRHQEYRARYPAAGRDLGGDAVRRPDAARGGADVLLSRDRDLVPGRCYGRQDPLGAAAAVGGVMWIEHAHRITIRSPAPAEVAGLDTPACPENESVP